MTLGGLLVRILLGAVVPCAVLGAAAQSPQLMAYEQADQAPAVTPEQRRAAVVDELVAAHGCWTGRAPKGIYPTRAVVDTGSGPRLTASAVGFGIWLDGDAGEHFAFCP